MREAVIVSTARTPIGRANRGAFNNIKSPTLTAHAIRHAVARAGIEGREVEDVLIGAALTAGTAGRNLARASALAAGLGDGAAGQTIDRQCSSGLMAIATGAKQIIVDSMDVVVAGGSENVSALSLPYLEWALKEKDENVIAQSQHAYLPMLQT
ncbi:MAG: atoB, partial [Nevskia sp.]|nr:atoB [Nevskia sp.]